MPSWQAEPQGAAFATPSAPLVERRRIVASKLAAPPLRSGVVERPALLDALMSTTTSPVVLVSAPAGYGKTMLRLPAGPVVAALVDHDCPDNERQRCRSDLEHPMTAPVRAHPHDKQTVSPCGR